LIGKRGKTALDTQGKNMFFLKKININKLWHIKSAGTLMILTKVGKRDVTETENNLEHHP